MKKICFLLIIHLCFGFYFSPARAQSAEAQQLLLNVEKLTQLKKILQDLKTGYEIISQGYNTIKSISEGNFNLHEEFLNSLVEVNPSVRKYKRIKDIMSMQLQLIKVSKEASRQFQHSKQLNENEIRYTSFVYQNLLQQSLKNLDALMLVVTSGKLRMSDDERLQAIDNIWKDMQEKHSFLQHFNTNTHLLVLQRGKEKGDMNTIKTLYGIAK